MPRGKAAQVGDTRISPNGYQYTRTDSRWRLSHHIAMERILGRPLREDERVVFVTDNKLDFSEQNLRVEIQGRGSLRRRKAQLEARIQELQAQVAEIEKQLRK